MSNIATKITELIGSTPVLKLEALCKAENAMAPIYAKIESFNPGGSVKDRVALSMIKKAEADGSLQPGYTIIEPTSGNTGVGIAMVGAVRGYKVVLTMPETMSLERRQILQAYGAEILLTPGDKGMAGAIEEAQRLHSENPRSVILGQFVNPANPEVHVATTGPEIWRDMDGCIDIFVACVGTGGTVTGVGTYLKQRNPAVTVVAVEPAESPVLSGGAPGQHGIQGIGAGFVPQVYNPKIIDRVVCIATDEAKRCERLLATTEGVLAGISAGAAIAACLKIASEPENVGKRIVTILPDTGERYLSTGVFN